MRAVILLVLLAVVAYVCAAEHPLNKILKQGEKVPAELKQKLVQKIKDRVKSKLAAKGLDKAVLKEKIANKLKQLKSRNPRSKSPKSRKPKSDKPSKKAPKSRKPLKEKIAGLEKKLAALKKKLAEKKAKKTPKSKSPKSKSPKSRKPKSDKPAKKTPKSKSPKSRKPKSDKPAKSRKPRSRKPKSDKPAKTLSDSKFFDQVTSWWNNKGKNIFTEENVEKAKKAYEIFQQAKQLIKDSKDKKDAEEAPEAPESDQEDDSDDDEDTVSCGQAYDHGKALGEKQCVMVQGKPVVVETAAAFRKMEAAAKAAGITLQVNSGFRKMSEQEHLYNCYLTKKCNNGNLAARPGFSNHQNGKAMDIAVADTKVFTWMRNNASKFGFVRTVPTENWHWELRNAKCNAFVSYTCQ